VSEMKLIMEGWRGYLVEDVIRKPLFEDYAYVSGVLGIQLPLDESGAISPLTEELKQKILEEQMLFEGFWDDVVQKVKTKAGELGGQFVDAVEGIKKFGEDGWMIIQQLYRVATNPDLIGNFIGATWKMGIKSFTRQIRNTLQQLSERLSEWGMPTFADMSIKALETFNKVIGSVENMEQSWKKVIAVAGLAIGMRWLWDKVKDFIEPYTGWIEKIKGAIDDHDSQVMKEFKAWLQDTVQEKLVNSIQSQFSGIIDKLISVASGIKPWWDAAVKVVGSVDLVIRSLRGAMGRFRRHTGGSGEDPALAAFSAAFSQSTAATQT